MKTKIFMPVLFFLAVSVCLNAQNNRPGQVQQNSTPVNQGVFTDANNNGVCDNYERPGIYYRGGRGMGASQAPAQAPGYRRGLAQGQGRGLVAAGNGRGRGMGPGQDRGQATGGRFFVDQNKNGVCDTYENAVNAK